MLTRPFHAIAVAQDPPYARSPLRGPSILGVDSCDVLPTVKSRLIGLAEYGADLLAVFAEILTLAIGQPTSG
jgi:hypothetical protein